MLIKAPLPDLQRMKLHFLNLYSLPLISIRIKPHFLIDNPEAPPPQFQSTEKNFKLHFLYRLIDYTPASICNDYIFDFLKEILPTIDIGDKGEQQLKLLHLSHKATSYVA